VARDAADEVEGAVAVELELGVAAREPAQRRLRAALLVVVVGHQQHRVVGVLETCMHHTTTYANARRRRDDDIDQTRASYIGKKREKIERGYRHGTRINK